MKSANDTTGRLSSQPRGDDRSAGISTSSIREKPTTRPLTRRSLLVGAAAASVALPSLGRSRSAYAADGRVPFGAAIQTELMNGDPSYRELFLKNCDLVMPMNALKFSLLRPTRDIWDFAPADKVVDFALGNGKTTRGTCHVWWGATPDWVKAIESPSEAEKVLVEHIERVGDRYKGKLRGWDVANEVVANDPLYENRSLRDTYWLRVLGPRHIPIAFKAAANADPAADLVLNDYDLEYQGPHYDERRTIVLSIVRQLQDANVKIDAVGLQGHLYADKVIDVDAIDRFHRDLDALGVKLIVTELDIIDWKSPAGAQSQDKTAAELVTRFLDAVFAFKAPELVVSWGLTDRYSWVNDVMPRPDGAESRPLPFDRALLPKPWFETLRKRLAEA
ncbi:endo-1,4-beta-xylanase [Jiella mangrovi]|uniref:Beta-xylanase n=1 Tax=Jiella mangrovi TaxID=2821407 RepID=A0ABS4BKE4_9HYPH|nr:endo-1,4-beta-xylanase [Jiella mangrovi]MBP0616520.1 endo-1,4-beta-xylanase [Jiella mangrovi]